MEETHHTVLNWIGNGASVGAIIGAFTGYLPSIGALIAIIWYAIQIAESETVMKWRKDRLRKRLQRLHQQTTALELRLIDPLNHETVQVVSTRAAQGVAVDAGLEQARRKPKSDEPSPTN